MTKWTQDEYDKLEKLWITGMPTGSIAKEFVNRSRNSIIGAAHRLNLESRLPPRKQLAPVTATPIRARPMRIMPSVIPDMPLDATEMAAHAVGFMDLKNHHCRAVIVPHDPATGLAIYCGVDKVEGKSWCYHHFKQFTYVPQR